MTGARVDDAGTSRKKRDLPCADHAPCLVGQRRGDNEEVCLGQPFAQQCGFEGAVEMPVWLTAARKADAANADRPEAGGDRAAERARSEEERRLAANARGEGLAPEPVPLAGDMPRDAFVEHEHRHHAILTALFLMRAAAVGEYGSGP